MQDFEMNTRHLGKTKQERSKLHGDTDTALSLFCSFRGKKYSGDIDALLAELSPADVAELDELLGHASCATTVSCPEVARLGLVIGCPGVTSLVFNGLKKNR